MPRAQGPQVVHDGVQVIERTPPPALNKMDRMGKPEKINKRGQACPPTREQGSTCQRPRDRKKQASGKHATKICRERGTQASKKPPKHSG